MTKFIIIQGGTATGTGKTVFAASLGYILSTYGMKVSMIKFDGIMNISFESMFISKYPDEFVWEDEEVFMTNDGSFVNMLKSLEDCLADLS